MKKISCPLCGSDQIRLEPQTPRKRNRLLDLLPFIGRRRPHGLYILTCRKCGRQTEMEI